MEHLHVRMDYATRLFQKAEYEEAKIVFGHLLKLYKRQAKPDQVRICLYRLACIAYVDGERQKFHEFFTHYQEWRPHQQEAEYYVLKGLEELSLQRYEPAIKVFTDVLPIAEKAGLVDQKLSALLYIQTCHIALGRMQLSLEMSDELWTTHQEEIQTDTGHFFHYLLNRADTLHGLERLAEMDELLEACEAHKDLSAVPNEHIKTLLMRAKFHMARKERRAAAASLEKAGEVAEAQANVHLRSEVYKALIDNYAIRGKTKQALRYEKKRLALHRKAVKK
ncbi:MAG: hypothetical protein ACI33P_14575 [Lysinibacillus sp.]